ncbi:hypothetical protein [Streptomyces palmae]|uniref:WD40 repeat domain-containing protein n=1 Tax=Streptomyces palmae TaxID=1701085 RepID=A0A4Z0GW47_9ACTN|nr:hypothetical protein [Streptomyces palmae]TGB00560.1 hypothetical protein E4099_21845 [Streptomyces palmae]
MRSPLCVLGAAVLLALSAAPPALAAGDDQEPSSFTIEDERISESSGLAASRLHPGVYWTHNDSSDGPYVYAVDSKTGRTVATVTLQGIGRPRDVEGISIGPDGNVYVGDIGDNLGGKWSKVWIYRFPEPKRLGNTTVRATQFDVQYEGGPRNAEALMVDPRSGRVYIASKSDEDPGLYVGPPKLSSGGMNVFKRVSDLGMEVTDGAFSPDGSRLLLRGYFSVAEYHWGPKGLGKRVSDDPGLPLQRQGESVTFTPDGGTLMYGTEGPRSPVTAVSLDGEQVPDATAAEQRRNGGGNGGRHGAAADGDGTDGGLSARTVLVGAVVVGVLAFLGLLGKKGRRRG